MKTSFGISIFSRKIILSALMAISFTETIYASEPTIGSTSLCGDAYLLALAPDHISALSWQSRSRLSDAEHTHRALPQLWDELEVLTTSPSDYVLFGAGEGQNAKKLNLTSLQLTWGEDFNSVIENADLVSQSLNVDNVLKTNLMQRLDDLKARSTKRAYKPKVFYLARSGGSAGDGTFVDAAITAAGGVNIAPKSRWFTPDPEEIITLKPDLIITSYFNDGYESINAAALRNRAVQKFISATPRVEIDGALWPCAGPRLIEAAEQIASAMDKLP